jgi:hypothetical protein
MPANESPLQGSVWAAPEITAFSVAIISLFNQCWLFSTFLKGLSIEVGVHRMQDIMDSAGNTRTGDVM